MSADEDYRYLHNGVIDVTVINTSDQGCPLCSNDEARFFMDKTGGGEKFVHIFAKGWEVGSRFLFFN